MRKIHYIKDGKAICGHPSPLMTIDLVEKTSCIACLKKIHSVPDRNKLPLRLLKNQ